MFFFKMVGDVKVTKQRRFGTHAGGNKATSAKVSYLCQIFKRPEQLGLLCTIFLTITHQWFTSCHCVWSRSFSLVYSCLQKEGS